MNGSSPQARVIQAVGGSLRRSTMSVSGRVPADPVPYGRSYFDASLDGAAWSIITDVAARSRSPR
ncbi:MAG: hypothetical protein M5T61_10455 [Acidimicrobiia bacterium]|nr:hypothetical protein [Acidimicrobiia bacterium]